MRLYYVFLSSILVLIISSFQTHALRLSMSSKDSLGCYIHIPFCRRRCYYCDFPISVVGDSQSAQSRASSDYTELILREMDASASGIMTTGIGKDTDRRRTDKGKYRTDTDSSSSSSYRKPPLARPLETVYFGGGTPSLMDAGDIGRILEGLDRQYGLCLSSDSRTDIGRSGRSGSGISGSGREEGVGYSTNRPTEITMEMDPGTFDLHQIQELRGMGVNRVRE